jgi:hypothetical protein
VTGVPPWDPTAPPGQAPPGWYAVPDPNQNWGLAPGGHRNAAYLIGVPRPPRPRPVGLAIALTYAGVGISAAYTVANAVFTLANKDRLIGAMTANAGPEAPDPGPFMSTTMTAGVVIAAVVWLLAAVGTVLCAVPTRRGRNPARIVLVSLVGVFALNNLCGGVGGLLLANANIGQVPPFTGAPVLAWWAGPTQLLLGALAVTIVVLLLLPTANRYFSPGVGRRFVD